MESSNKGCLSENVCLYSSKSELKMEQIASERKTQIERRRERSDQELSNIDCDEQQSGDNILGTLNIMQTNNLPMIEADPEKLTDQLILQLLRDMQSQFKHESLRSIIERINRIYLQEFQNGSYSIQREDSVTQTQDQETDYDLLVGQDREELNYISLAYQKQEIKRQKQCVQNQEKDLHKHERQQREKMAEQSKINSQRIQVLPHKQEANPRESIKALSSQLNSSFQAESSRIVDDQRAVKSNNQTKIKNKTEENIVQQQISADPKERQRQFARVLIEAGYALPAAEKYFKSMPCAQDFYGIMKAIVGSTFRCLERVVAKECKRRIVFINFKLMLKIKMELVHCSDWLDNENKATLFEFVKCVYDLKPSPVTKKQALKLYESIMRRLEFYLHTSQEQKDQGHEPYEEAVNKLLNKAEQETKGKPMSIDPRRKKRKTRQLEPLK